MYYVLYQQHTANATCNLQMKNGKIKGKMESLQDHSGRLSCNTTF